MKLIIIIFLASSIGCQKSTDKCRNELSEYVDAAYVINSTDLYILQPAYSKRKINFVKYKKASDKGLKLTSKANLTSKGTDPNLSPKGFRKCLYRRVTPEIK